jgi:hypothetical protein
MSVLIIGNGYDLSMGMSTSYSDYLKSDFFISLTENNSIAKYLHNQFNHSPNWFDLEYNLGKYSFENENINSIRQEFNCILESIKKFLNNTRVNIDKNTISYDLVKSFIGQGQIWVFNYTETVEATFQSLYRTDNPKDYIKHIHGDLISGEIIVGTDDTQKIPSHHACLKKASFRIYNPKEFKRQIFADNHIIIFGHSLGISDSFYFQDLFDHIMAERSVDEYRIQIYF